MTHLPRKIQFLHDARWLESKGIVAAKGRMYKYGCTVVYTVQILLGLSVHKKVVESLTSPNKSSHLAETESFLAPHAFSCQRTK